MGRMIYKKWEKNYPKVAKKYTEDKCLKCAKVPKMSKVGRRGIQKTVENTYAVSVRRSAVSALTKNTEDSRQNTA